MFYTQVFSPILSPPPPPPKILPTPLSNHSPTPPLRDADFISSLVIWALTECWLVLILGCLPPLRPLFVSVFHQLSTSASHSRPKHSGYYNNYPPGGIPMYPPHQQQQKQQYRAGTFLTEEDDDADAESERKILGPEIVRRGGGEGILRTTHVHVASTAKAGEREGEGEDSDGSLGEGAGVGMPGGRGVAY